MDIKNNYWRTRGELPPVGEVVEYSRKNNKLSPHCIVDTWVNGDRLNVVARVEIGSNVLPVVQNMRTQQVSTILPELIKPLRTERDELIERALKASEEVVSGRDVAFAEALIDAGWRPDAEHTERLYNQALKDFDKLHAAAALVIENHNHGIFDDVAMRNLENAI